ncbi:hypothetical protein KBC31_00925 [Candidatus Saccharibacteria bacterium]|jgi:hypothetical protein|nr:hypothetical protein [Candidatus Saccharibacteria bacterium]
MDKPKPNKLETERRNLNRGRKRDSGEPDSPPIANLTFRERDEMLRPSEAITKIQRADLLFSPTDNRGRKPRTKSQEPTEPEVVVDSEVISEEARKVLISSIKDTEPLISGCSEEELGKNSFLGLLEKNAALRRMLNYRREVEEEDSELPALEPLVSSHLSMMIAVGAMPLMDKASGSEYKKEFWNLLGPEVHEKLGELVFADLKDKPTPDAATIAMEDYLKLTK